MPFDYEKTLAHIPQDPGVYIMKDKREQVIYVGKAKNLHRRVSQYFSGHDDRAFVSMLDDLLGRIDVIITSDEREALILEAGLIKQYRPRFNVILKDDKDMPQLRIDPRDPWPKVEIVRRRKKDGAHYYGPFPSGQACRLSLGVINRHFMLRTCRDHVFENRSRPCLQYEIHRCLAPCVFDVDREEYLKNCRDAELFLAGKFEDLQKTLRDRMMAASDALEFEQAANYRDQLRSVEEVCAAQKIVQKTPVNQDFWAFDGNPDFRAFVVMMVRNGRLLHMQTYEARDAVSPLDDIMSQIIVHHYQTFDNYPGEVILDPSFEDIGPLIEATLSDLSKKKITLTFPKRGIKSELLATAYANAHQQFIERRTTEEALLERVQKTLSLSHYPHRIECYDISNMQGGQIVAAMVVFIEGRLDVSRCRNFKVRTTEGQDDFGSLNEVLSRRLRYLTATPDTEGEDVGANERSFCEMPDLLLIDGGHGQVSAVVEAVKNAGMLGVFDIVGIGKSRVKGDPNDIDVKHSPERLYYPDVPDPLVLDQSCPEILLMANIRDETHKRAIGFHRKQRENAGMHSRLDDIEGIGPKRKSKLLREFGSLKEISKQSPERLAEVAGMSIELARKLLDAIS
ncbi:MAG: excinuclease ABC subunit UvrC [Proteobacteria bacterium]|nr:excinuclease ABC subunit UvrC [Pseudomonadota bacterium]